MVCCCPQPSLHPTNPSHRTPSLPTHARRAQSAPAVCIFPQACAIPLSPSLCVSPVLTHFSTDACLHGHQAPRLRPPSTQLAPQTRNFTQSTRECGHEQGRERFPRDHAGPRAPALDGNGQRLAPSRPPRLDLADPTCGFRARMVSTCALRRRVAGLPHERRPAPIDGILPDVPALAAFFSGHSHSRTVLLSRARPADRG